LDGYECINDSCQTCGSAGALCCVDAFGFNEGCGGGLSCTDGGTCADDGCGSADEPCCPIGPNDGCGIGLDCNNDDICVP
jgi:hypothetical protein